MDTVPSRSTPKADLESVLAVYEGSNGKATAALYVQLEAIGPIGVVAMNLFRACKCSERAKGYRLRSHAAEAYRRKQWSMENLCVALDLEAESLGIRWGWGVDEVKRSSGSPHHHVLYVEIGTGQVSFHTDHRCPGPDYGAPWDGVKGQSAGRIITWTARVLAGDILGVGSVSGDRVVTAGRPDVMDGGHNSRECKDD